MSWKDKIKNKIKVTTGDGKEYFLTWTGKTEDEEEYHIKEFTFPNVEGTEVRRGKTKGRRFQFEVFFEGDDHIEDSEDFRLSARIEKTWIVEHPYFNSIRVQPKKLKFDRKKYNITKVTGILLENIEQPRPATSDSPIQEIAAQKVVI
jgi:hypothetical protein